MSALRVQALTHAFGEQPVLRGIDLEVTDGITAILGSSGSGKTTLLRVVAGFLTPTSGSVAVHDRVVAAPGVAVPSRLRRIGYVPQEGALFPHLDVVGNVGFGLPRRERSGPRVHATLDLVGLPRDLARRYPHELSGGQQQRVALARALVTEPELVLLDEPFSSLDSSLREETGIAVVNALRASGAAAVLVTHDRGEALSLADQVAVMARGVLLQVAPPAELYLAPAGPEVAGFVSDALLLEATCADGTATSALGQLQVLDASLDGPCTIAVRQEQVLPELGGTSGVAAEVTSVAFLGRQARVRARLVAGPLEVTCVVPTGSAPHPGDRVSLRVTGPVTAFPRGAPS